MHSGPCSLIESTVGIPHRTLSGHTDWARALALDNRGNLYSGSDDRSIRVWSTSEHTHIRTLTGHTFCVFAVAAGTNGTVFSGSLDKTIKVWSGTDGTLLNTLLGHSGGVYSLTIAPDGALLSGGGDGMKVWFPQQGWQDTWLSRAEHMPLRRPLGWLAPD
eukprot:m.418785 g.418785  ORF g.418785 m.418785 type:complete len:161 (+) comp16835_c0_seq19:3712-4194(+)